MPAGTVGSRSTATRVTWGATSLSNSSHFPLVPNSSHTVKPVALPPGRDKLSTKPALTGSGICTNTIGTVRLACCSAATGPVPEAWITSGARAINSAAYLRLRSAALRRPAPPATLAQRPTFMVNSPSPYRREKRQGIKGVEEEQDQENRKQRAQPAGKVCYMQLHDEPLRTPDDLT